MSAGILNLDDIFSLDLVILFASRKIFAGLLWHILSLKKAFRTCLSWIKAGTDLKLLRDDQKIDCRGSLKKVFRTCYIYKENLEIR